MFIKSLRNANTLDSDVLYRYSKTVKLWLFDDTGGNPGLGAMETVCIPHNCTVTDYTVRKVSVSFLRNSMCPILKNIFQSYLKKAMNSITLQVKNKYVRYK